ncbi:MAG: S8 family serine peptidase [Acidimicrobiaceae bacterium]|nr:S8 family serine peptidase [Acidimicrobiaceae bacterium]
MPAEGVLSTSTLRAGALWLSGLLLAMSVALLGALAAGDGHSAAPQSAAQLPAEPSAPSALHALPAPFESQTAAALSELSELPEPSATEVAQAVAPNAPILYRGEVGLECQEFEAWLSDELSGCLWHLDKARSFDRRLGSAPAGGDINIGNAWATSKGANVNVAVLDETWNPDHHDIVDNVDLSRSIDYTGTSAGEGPTGHGTSVAGVIAARDNEVGGRGVAPRATLFNYNVVASPASLSDALKRNATVVAVYNGSFGGSDDPPYQRISSAAWNALEQGRTSGFGGLGSLYVFSSGNGRTSLAGSGQVNINERHAHPAALAVCAVDDDGVHASYSNIGSGLWMCAPSEGDAADDDNQLLAPTGDNLYAVFGKTSAAAPQVSGVIALVRSANPYLSWRDVKLLLAGTAQKNHPSHSGWRTGGVKYGSSSSSYNFNHHYGFGVVDASAAVAAALRWQRLPAELTQTVSSGEIRLPKQGFPSGVAALIPNDGTALEHSLEVPSGAAIDFIEHLSVNLDISSQFGRDLRIEVVSPSGTTSTLIEPIGHRDHCYGLQVGEYYFPDCDFPRSQSNRPDGMLFASNAFLGEDPEGTWTLRITDTVSNGVPRRPSDDRRFEDLYRSKLNSWDLHLRGHSGSSSDSAPRARLSVSGASGLEATTREGAHVVVTATLLDGVASREYTLPVSVVDGSATFGARDFARRQVQVTIPQGSRSGSAQLAVLGDSIDEPDETFTLKWRDQSSGTGPDSLLYLGDPVEVTISGTAATKPLLRAQLSVASTCVTEGGSVEVSVKLFGGTHADDIKLPVEVRPGTARVSGVSRGGGRNDVFPILNLFSDSVENARIRAGQTRFSGSLTTIADSAIEDNETFTIVLHRPAGLADVVTVTDSPVTITIVDDDRRVPRPCVERKTPVVEWSRAAGDSVTEGGAIDYRLALNRSLVAGETLTVPLTFNTGNGAATRGADYTLACPTSPPAGVACSNLNSGAATIKFTGPAAGSVTVTLTAETDSSIETSDEPVDVGIGALEPVGFDLAGSVDKAAALTIKDLPPTTGTPAVTISQSGSSTLVAENAGTDTYTVVLNAQPSADVIIVVRSRDPGTALIDGPDDSTAPTSSERLTFTADNYNTPQTVTVTGVDDDIDNPGDHRNALIVHLVGPASATEYISVEVASVVVTVTDDDSAVQPVVVQPVVVRPVAVRPVQPAVQPPPPPPPSSPPSRPPVLPPPSRPSRSSQSSQPPPSRPAQPPPSQPTAAAVDPDEEFSDLADAAPVHAEALNSLISAGVFEGTGCGEERLCPAEPILRWEMAVLLVRIIDDEDPDASEDSRFDDVDASLWWAAFVDRLAELKVTLGCSLEPANYCPLDAVTRGQMATFLTRAFDLAAAPSAGFVDATEEGDAHEAGIDSLAAAEITSGCSTDPLRFCPADPTSRQQMASFLHRASKPS